MATKFEFEWRFWIITAIYWSGFVLYNFDHRGVAETLLRITAPSVPPASPGGVIIQQAILLAGALLVFFAALFRTWATAYLGADVMSDQKLHSDSLAVDGPYRHTRNPLYFANLPLAVGVGVFSNPTGFLLICLANTLFVFRLIAREEANLRGSLGSVYARYSAEVPRFWPSFKPRVPASGRTPRWRQAFFGELLLWLIGVALVLFVVTLNQRLLLGGIAISFAVSLGLGFVTKRRTASVQP
ncbi:MAG TPA: isoprenylcysteine carboxylmethyltransferase family protein [Rhizomicrobium sp.]|nr:isoprenylcysteine carboxylmethyltransferase family protein [Rhizomicrobium sp.]